MIRQHSILVASPIALAIQHRENSVYDKASDFIQSLVDVSTGLVPLTPDNLATEVPAATELGSEHALKQQQAIEMITTGVQNAFKQIRQYLRPLDAAITEGVRDLYSPTSAITCVHNNFYISYTELDHPFFTSHLFPEGEPSKVWDYSNFQARELTEYANCLPALEYNQMEDLLKTTSDELNHHLDIERTQTLYNAYVARGEWSGLFIAEGDRLVLDRNQTPQDLIQLYIVLSRLNVEETPLEGVQNMTLEMYRSYINTALNVVIYGLQRTRRYYQDLAKQVLPVMKVQIDERRSEFGTVSGQLRVGLTDRAIEVIEENNTSLSEVLLGYAVALANNPAANHVPPLDAIPGYLEKYQVYLNSVKAEIVSACIKNVSRVVETCLNDFQKQHAELGAICEKFNDDLPYRRLTTAMNEVTSKWVHRHRDLVVNGNMDSDVFLSTPTIAIEVGKRLGMTFAAEILTRSVVTSNMSLEERRDKLAEAVGECVTSLCLGNHL
ncbi:phage protein [Vibrio phage pTD1]|uniref:Phage protein n=1 Tax=Vibrio phage pTD1 TaxID=1938577 RepID=A0A1Q2U348_9CAUD|nr:virion structural protein [Vibrio phage pTD1]BAW98398.1 phage protein [Vibrio phage pTD1]